MSNIVVFYFHGFASGVNSKKFQSLIDAGFETYGVDIPIPYTKAKHTLVDYILDKFNELDLFGKTVVFVGTSLGGYWASRMAQLFDVPAFLINPALDPANSLKQYLDKDIKNYVTGEKIELSEEIISGYFPIEFPQSIHYHDHIFISANDPVIDQSVWLTVKRPFLRIYDSADHRFDDNWGDVIAELKAL